MGPDHTVGAGSLEKVLLASGEKMMREDWGNAGRLLRREIVVFRMEVMDGEMVMDLSAL